MTDDVDLTVSVILLDRCYYCYRAGSPKFLKNGLKALDFFARNNQDSLVFTFRRLGCQDALHSVGYCAVEPGLGNDCYSDLRLIYQLKDGLDRLAVFHTSERFVRCYECSDCFDLSEQVSLQFLIRKDNKLIFGFFGRAGFLGARIRNLRGCLALRVTEA